ncbi:MAG: hypothetical protein ACOCY1_04135 [Halovenus sp.]
MTDTTIDDIEAALKNHRETLAEIALAVGIKESTLPDQPGKKAQRAAFFGDSESAKAYHKEAEKNDALTRHFQESMELADLIEEEVNSGRSKRNSAHTESAEAAAFRELLRGGE